jgi:hypothetical protein
MPGFGGGKQSIAGRGDGTGSEKIYGYGKIGKKCLIQYTQAAEAYQVGE